MDVRRLIRSMVSAAAIGMFATPALATAPGAINELVVATQQGVRHLEITLNTRIDASALANLQVTMVDGEETVVVEGRAHLEEDILHNSVIVFEPTNGEALKNIVTVRLGDARARLVPGTGGIQHTSGGAMASAGFAYDSMEAASYSKRGTRSGIFLLDSIPRNNATNISPASNLLFFFSDIIDTDTVSPQNFVVEQIVGEGEEATRRPIDGTVDFTTSTAGNTIVTFLSREYLPANATISARVNDIYRRPYWAPIWDDYFNKLPELSEESERATALETLVQDLEAATPENETFVRPVMCSGMHVPAAPAEVMFTTGDAIPEGDAVRNFDFRNGALDGYAAYGNVKVLPHYGTQTFAREGRDPGFAAVLTTGAGENPQPPQPFLENSDANVLPDVVPPFIPISNVQEGNAGSTLTTAPFKVPEGARWLAFDLDFLTAEFPDWVGSIYDDTALVTIRTPFGAQTMTAASVNSLGLFEVRENSGEPGLISSFNKFAILDGAYLPAVGEQRQNGHTTRHTRAFDVSYFAGKDLPISVSFQITNVGDNVYQSSLIVDNLRFLEHQPGIKAPDAAYNAIETGLLFHEDEDRSQRQAGQVPWSNDARRDARYTLLQSKDDPTVFRLHLLKEGEFLVLDSIADGAFLRESSPGAAQAFHVDLLMSFGFGRFDTDEAGHRRLIGPRNNDGVNNTTLTFVPQNTDLSGIENRVQPPFTGGPNEPVPPAEPLPMPELP